MKPDLEQAAARLFETDPSRYAQLRNAAAREAALVRSNPRLTPTKKRAEHARIRREYHAAIEEAARP